MLECKNDMEYQIYLNFVTITFYSVYVVLAQGKAVSNRANKIF
jgi:hypothetical protein